MRLNRLWPWWERVNRDSFRADLMAGLTGAIIVLPQGVAYAMIAGLPAEYGLYTAIVPAIVAALCGSSHHLISGPTAALSVIVFTTVSQYALPGSDLYLQLALTLTLCAGVVQLVLGLARFGALVNFVSHSVVLGFTAGAAVVITISQIKHLFGLNVSGGQTALENLWLTLHGLSGWQPLSLLVGSVTIAVCVVVQKWWPKWPNMLLAMLASALVAHLLSLSGHSLALVGEVPAGLPVFTMPSLEQAGSMLSGIVAVALLGLVEAISIARSVALRSRQRLDANREFIGQGLSNIAGAFFSCYVSSGSFTRSGVNYTSGAQTPLAAVFAGVILAVIMLMLAEYASYIPVAGMAGILLVVAFKLIDVEHIGDILRHDRKESLVLVVTFVAAVTLHLELAVYAGVAVSLFFYLRQTSRPVVDYLDNDELGLDGEAAEHTQVIRINGSIFFGCVPHLHCALEAVSKPNLVILGRGINFIDHPGAQLLAEQVAQSGRQVYFCRFKPGVQQTLEQSCFARDFDSRRFYPRLSELITELGNGQCKYS